MERIASNESGTSVAQEELGLRRIVVVGGGTMGQGLALAGSQSGIHVHIVELDEHVLKNSLAAIEGRLDAEIQRWALTESEKRVIFDRIRGSASLESASEAELVIEAVPEDFDLKQEVLRRLEEVVSPDTILVTNTSTLSISEMAAGLQRPERLIGMHFIFPVPKVPLVEVVRGLHTSNETYAAAVDFARRLGKTPVQVFEYPGFITTRAILPFINEAMHIVMEGVATAEDVDTALSLGYDFPHGPLELADRMGLDEVMAWCEHLFHELGDLKYRPCPLLRKMVRAGRLGVKSGQGFFQYRKDGKRIR